MEERLAHAQKYLAKRERHRLQKRARAAPQASVSDAGSGDAMDTDGPDASADASSGGSSSHNDGDVSDGDDGGDTDAMDTGDPAPAAPADGITPVVSEGGAPDVQLVGETLACYDVLARLVLRATPLAQISRDPAWQAELGRGLAPTPARAVSDALTHGYAELLRDVVARMDVPDAGYSEQRRQHIRDQQRADRMEVLAGAPPAPVHSLITGAELPAGAPALRLRLLHGTTVLRDGWFEPRSRNLVDCIFLAFHFVPQMQGTAATFQGDHAAWHTLCLRRFQVAVLTLARLLKPA
jgi:hypothetical protein